MILFDQHLINVLTQFFLDKSAMQVYHGRWDTWLMVNGHRDEYFAMMWKTDNQVNAMILTARNNAEQIKLSPLEQALNETSED
jgi:hypothetical protein